jgi:hypothetical protein
MEMEVRHLSRPLRLLNRVVKLVPADGQLRQMSVLKVWFAPGHLEAAQQLWEWARWQWRDRGGVLGFSYDSHSLLGEVFRPPVWMPITSLMIAVSEQSSGEGRLIYGG